MHYSVKPSLRRNHPHRRTTIAISSGPELRRSMSITIAIIKISEIAIAISPISREASIDASRDRDRRDCDRDLADRDRADRDRDRSDRDLTECASFWVFSPRNWFVLGFIWVFRNEWHYVFVWELRKCEKMWATSKKCVSMVFSRIQPNIRKYCPKIFLKCNQTHENIFFSEK